MHVHESREPAAQTRRSWDSLIGSDETPARNPADCDTIRREWSSGDPVKTIKRYPNRKLYDTEASRYITLEEIAEHLRVGGEVRVVDSRTGQDITSVTLAQVLVGEEKRQRREIPFQRLLALLQTGGDYLHRKIGTPVTSLKGEAERTVHRIIRGDPPEELRDFIMATHRAYDDVQRRVDERLQVVLATVRNLSPVLKEIARLQDEVAALRARVEALERRDSQAGRDPPRTSGPGSGPDRAPS